MAQSKTKAAQRKLKTAKDKAADTVSDAASKIKGPSPNPMTNLVIADIALRGGSYLMRRGLERGFLGAKYSSKKARQILKSRTLGETLLSAAISRAATTSVPGAILVGGGLLAKTLYDRRKGKLAEIEGKAELEERAAEGAAEENAE